MRLAPRERLIVALDVPSVAEAEAIVVRLGESVAFYKIGYQLAFAGGIDFAKVLASAGKRIFLDLKLHDIGNTVAKGVESVAALGASFLTVPSAFTRKTGEAHWHTLLRARAIETGCFVFAAAQCGLHENKRETFGHSLIIAPWGEILAEGGVEPGVFLAEIDPAKVEAARKTVPSLQHGRRFGIADPKAGPEHLHLVRGSA